MIWKAILTFAFMAALLPRGPDIGFMATPDFAMVARGMGMHGESVVGVSQFEDAFARACKATGPVLLDIDMSALAPMPGLAPPPQRGT